MGVKSDRWIRANGANGMIAPFAANKVRQVDGRSVLSYGTESYGYTLCVADEWRVVDPSLSPAQLAAHVVDPKRPETLDAIMTPLRADQIVIPPHSFVLARSAERWRIPRDVLCVVVGKSSYARVAMLLNVTPLEPGWGEENPAGGNHITLEISNTAPFQITVHAWEGVGQVIFLSGEGPAESHYGAAGRYGVQDGIVLPRR